MNEIPWAQYAALLGAGLAMGIGAIGPGVGLGISAVGSVNAMWRQPAVAGNAFRNMLVAQAVTETPAVFSLVIAFMLYFQAVGNPELHHSVAMAAVYLSTGICVGVGSLGSGVASGMVGRDALAAIGARPSSNGTVMLYMLIGQAWAQTGGIFALVVAMLMMNIGGLDALSTSETIFGSGKYLGAGISMGFGAVGPAVGVAYIAGRACVALARSEEGTRFLVRNAFFVGAATAQTTAIYALVIALLMMFQ